MARRLSFAHIEAFRAVVISGTTVAAARMLSTTQPSVSRLLSQAQRLTGLKLFTTSQGRLRLTSEGSHLYKAVEMNYRGLDEIHKAVASIRDSGSGILRIASTPTLAHSLVPRTLRLFSELYRNIHFQLKTLPSLDIRQGLRLGMFDVAVTNRLFEGEDCRSLRVDQRAAVCVMSPNDPLASKSFITPADLAGRSLIRLPLEDPLGRALAGILHSSGVVTLHSIEVMFASSVCSFAAEGLGVGVVNPLVAAAFGTEVVSKPLKPVLLAETYASTSLNVPGSEFIDSFVQMFADEISRA